MRKSDSIEKISAISCRKNTLEYFIKDLPKLIKGRGEVKGFIFTQLNKTKRAFLYEVNTGSGIYYEVFKKKINWRYGCISYPTSKAFGFYAWVFVDFDRAMEKFHQLNEN